jgi:hypothetical protein
MQWDEDNPSDRSQWLTQHGGLQRLDPPYVYNVFNGDLDGFVQAIKDAISHPIQRYVDPGPYSFRSWLISPMYSYVLEEMRMSSVEQRLGVILEKDWQREAAVQGS